MIPSLNNFNQNNSGFMNMNMNYMNMQPMNNMNMQPMNNMNNMNIQLMNNMNNNNLLNKLNKYKEENLKLKQQINNLQQEINKLNNKLQNANQSVINIQQQQFNYINEINNLRNQLKDKERELKDLNNNKNKDGYVNFNNIMVVHFISGDGKINQGIKCLPTDTFAQVEEKLYQIYDEYRDNYNNTFLARGNVIKRFKTMNENNIKNGDKIQLQNFNE